MVERRALDEFMAALEATVKGMKVGDPLDERHEMGPLISAGHREEVASFVPDDAPVAIRGSAPEGPGYWFPPTVLVAGLATTTAPPARRSSGRSPA